MSHYDYILYAPFIHTGGGKTLLIQLLSQIQDYANSLVIIDDRISFKFKANKKCDVLLIKKNYFSYALSEFTLHKCSTKKTRVLCLHGAPPLIRNPGYVIVFFQNRLHLIEKKYSLNFTEKLKKYFFTKSFSFCNEVIVQTDSMLYDFENFLQKNSLFTKLVKKPFFNIEPFKNNIPKKKFDFIYVADGSPHKNHKCLIEAWILLSKQNIRPSLVLTIPMSQKAIIYNIEALIKKYKLNIYNFSNLSVVEVNNLYIKSNSLIFPSLVESFGLPLLEASHHNLIIIAGELDYVRDVCVPNYTFNPLSPLSISRAVSRSLGIKYVINQPCSAKSFIEYVFRVVR